MLTTARDNRLGVQQAKGFIYKGLRAIRKSAGRSFQGHRKPPALPQMVPAVCSRPNQKPLVLGAGCTWVEPGSTLRSQVEVATGAPQQSDHSSVRPGWAVLSEAATGGSASQAGGRSRSEVRRWPGHLLEVTGPRTMLQLSEAPSTGQGQTALLEVVPGRSDADLVWGQSAPVSVPCWRQGRRQGQWSGGGLKWRSDVKVSKYCLVL